MNVLITGGAGFLGRQLTKDLVGRYPDSKLRLMDRSEETIRMVLDTIDGGGIETVIGDIRDKDVVRHAVSDTDAIFHLAAMKHIDFCEANVLEAVSINVGGTINLLKFFEGQTFIAMSTDKVVNPSGCYGATSASFRRPMRAVLMPKGRNLCRPCSTPQFTGMAKTNIKEVEKRRQYQ